VRCGVVCVVSLSGRPVMVSSTRDQSASPTPSTARNHSTNCARCEDCTSENCSDVIEAVPPAEMYLVTRPVIKFGRPRRLVRGDLLSVLERAAGFWGVMTEPRRSCYQPATTHTEPAVISRDDAWGSEQEMRCEITSRDVRAG